MEAGDSKKFRTCYNYQQQIIERVEGGYYLDQDPTIQLPDEILAYILSFLTLKDAIATSVLSKRWKGLWAFVTRLHFDHKISWLDDDLIIMKEKSASERQIVAKKLEAENTDRFVRQVNRVLKLHKSPTIEEFRVCVELDENYKINIDEWLKFALTRRVQRLELYMAWHHIGPLPCSRRPYNLVLPSETVSVSDFKSLKSLHLKAVDVSGQVLENILANCPVLEWFAVHGSLELKTFKLASPSLVLKYLEISWCPNLNSIEICNLTNLVRFGYRGPDMNLRLNNVPRLVELSISGRQIQQSMPDFLPKFSSCFSQLETLELDEHWYQPRIDHARRVKKAGKWPHERLEEVELAGYYGSKSHQELVIYFLENATILKRIIVRPCDQSHDYMKLQLPITRDVIMMEKAARRRAKEQLRGIIPPVDSTLRKSNKAEMRDLKAEVCDLSAEVYDLEAEVCDLNAEVYDLKAEHRAQVLDLKSVVRDLKAEARDLEAEVRDTKADLKAKTRDLKADPRS
ncbi:hypothetical protein LguiA_002596 [Lonicera macranthoides]